MIDTGNIVIVPKDGAYLVQHKETHKFFRLGPKEADYLMGLLSVPSGGVPEDADPRPLDAKEKDFLFYKFQQMGFLGEQEVRQKHKLNDVVLFSLSQKQTAPLGIRGFSHVISLAGLILVALLFAACLALLSTRGDAYLFGMAALMQGTDILWLLYMYSLFFISGMIHEFAHVAACYRYSGRIGRIGLKLYFGLPAFFSDVSDMYFVKGRKKSVVVSLSGVLSNLAIASLSVILYLLAVADGFWGKTLLSLVVINLAAFIFNLIPLAKFDGYWLLRSLSGMNNLYDKSISMFFFLLLHPRQFACLKVSGIKKAVMSFYGMLCYCFTYFLWYIFLSAANRFLADVPDILRIGVLCLLSLVVVAHIAVTLRAQVRQMQGGIGTK